MQQLDEAMAANLEAAAREREAADLKRRQESKLNDYKYTTDVWGTDPTDQELDGKKVRGCRVGCCTLVCYVWAAGNCFWVYGAVAS